MTTTSQGAVPGQRQPELAKVLGTRDVFVAGVALVVASTTLVSDFVGYFSLGLAFAMAIAVAFVINLLLGLSASELAVAYPRAGAIYEYGRDALGGVGGRLTGLFLGITFIGMYMLALTGETAAGAFGLQALFNGESGINWYIVVLVVLAAIPNIFGIRVAAWVMGGLLIGMLAIRWIFGLAGFLGVGDQGSWSSDNLDTGGAGLWDWFGDGGLLASGLVLAFWTFVGIEFACSLTEEVKDPRRAMPRGILLGLVVILGTSWLMGLGVAGTTPESGGTWAEAALGAAGCDGSCPQLAVGEEMFGGTGRGLMALASVFATLGSLVVSFAAIPRLIFGIARNGEFFGPGLSQVFARLHPTWRTPVVAIVAFVAGSTVLAMFSNDVVDWIFSGAYVWILIYVSFHLLALAKRILRPGEDEVFGQWFIAVPILGAVTTLIALHYAFAGVHGDYLPRALIVLGVAAAATLLDFAVSQRRGRRAPAVADASP